MSRITRAIAAFTGGAMWVFLLIGSQSPALAIDGQASSEIAVTLQPLRNVGVAFGWLPRATTTVTVTLNAPTQPEAMTIVDKKDKSTIPLDFGGKTIWRRTETTDTKHVWKGYGFSAGFPERVINTGTYVRFEGLLAKPGPHGVFGTSFKASVAAIDIDVDSTDRHSDGPSGNWPPISDTTPRGEIEDFDEDTPLGGLYLPVLSNQPLPDTINITAVPYKLYKTLNLKLSTSWGGHPQGDPPSWAGELKFEFGGKGFALYEIVEGSDQAQQIYDQNDPDPNHRKKIDVPLAGFPNKKFAVVTNNEFISEGSIKATFTWDSTLAGGPSTIAQDYARLVPYNNTLAKIKQVDFCGPEHRLKRDDDSASFEDPEWLDANLDGDTSDEGDRSFPVAYKRNTKIKLTATAVSDEIDPSATVHIRGTGPDNITIPSTQAAKAVVGNEVRYTITEVEVDTPFPDTIKYYQSFTIAWEITTDGGATWEAIGPTRNRCYVLWDDPADGLPALTWTVVHTTCVAADGTGGTDASTVLDKLWAKLKAKNVRRASDDVLLSYYGFYDTNGNGKWDAGVDIDRNSPTTCQTATYQQLVATGNGRCTAWMRFMAACLESHGISSVGGQPIQFGNIGPQVTGPPYVGALILEVYEKKGNHPEWVVVDADAGVDGGSPTPVADGQAADRKGTPGQGNSPNPVSVFDLHQVFWIGQVKFYDPSYGTGPFSWDVQGKKMYGDAFAGVGAVRQATGLLEKLVDRPPEQRYRVGPPRAVEYED